MILLQRHIWAVARMAPGSLWLLVGVELVLCGVPVVVVVLPAVVELVAEPTVDVGVGAVVVFEWAGAVGVEELVDGGVGAVLKKDKDNNINKCKKKWKFVNVILFRETPTYRSGCFQTSRIFC